MKAIFSAIGKFICGVFKLAKNIIFISFIFLLVVFILAVIMPQNVEKAIEIFKNFL